MPVNAIKRFGAGYRKKTWAKPNTGLWQIDSTIVEKAPKAPVPTRPVIIDGYVTGQRGRYIITNTTQSTVTEVDLQPPFELSDFGSVGDALIVEFFVASSEGPNIVLPSTTQILVTAVGTLSRSGDTVTLTPATWDTGGVTVSATKTIDGVTTALVGATFTVAAGQSYYVTETASKTGLVTSAPANTATGTRPAATPTLVGSKLAGWAGTTSDQTVSLTDLTGGIGTAPEAGDYVVVSYAIGFALGDPTLSVVTSGYTSLLTPLTASDTNITRMAGWAKFMSGTPDTSIIVSGTGSSNNAGRVTISVYRGVDPTTPLDVAVSVSPGTGIDGGRPTPPPITPVTAGALIVAYGASAPPTALRAVFTSGLSDFISATANDTYAVVIGTGSSSWISGTYTPSQWGGNTTSTQASWAAFTLALRPAS